MLLVRKHFRELILKLIIMIYCLPFFVSVCSGYGETQDKKPQIPVNKERLLADVKILTSISPPRNYRNLSSLNRSGEYILEEFKKLGGLISVQRFIVGNNEYKNIICSFGPDSGQRLVIGAHYDVCGDQAGADDNASGVSGLLELGRLIKELKPALKSRVDLVAYSLEEPPFFRTNQMGSYVHAKFLSENRIKVKAMICLEAIGYFSDAPHSQLFPAFFFRWFYPQKGNFIIIVGKLGQGWLVREIKKYMFTASRIHVDTITAPSLVPGIDFSDHINYWKFGFPAVMVTDTALYRNPHYHEDTDTWETLDFDRMAEVIQGIYWAMIHL